MATIRFDELLNIIKTHPNYQQWEKGTPVEEALYIKFSEVITKEVVESDNFEATNGCEIVLDKDNKGSICGIEII